MRFADLVVILACFVSVCYLWEVTKLIFGWLEKKVKQWMNNHKKIKGNNN